MADVFSTAKRSAVMGRIRSRGNHGTELRLIAMLRAHKLRGWRRGAGLPGRPDFIWRRERLAVFVDGCFWHGCPRHGRTPGSHREYWVPKLARNAKRDRQVSRLLRKQGWSVLRVWECALEGRRALSTAARIARALGRRAKHRPRI